jgi:hypothetical protein
VVDWKQSLPQIIAAIIGSSLIVTALSTISSFLFKPGIDISVDPHPSDLNIQKMTYTIFLTNKGFTPATHLRLTMSYPEAEILRDIPIYENENMTVKREILSSSVVAFLPRLTPGASISIDTNITRKSTAHYYSQFSVAVLPYALLDYGNDKTTYVYSHNQPYSIVATYDQGSSEYRPPIIGPYYYPFNTGLLQSLILIVLALLSFAIALRHKRRSKSKFASNILTDIIKVRNELNDSSHKSGPSGLILRLHGWQSNIDSERQIVSDYRDYKKIDDFYTAVRSRNCYLIQNQVRSDILNILNKECVDKATIAYTEIDWTKFHKLDLIFLIPAIILGSLFITYVCEGIPYMLLVPLFSYPDSFIVFTITSLILRGISSFFIIRLTLRATQGVIVMNCGLPALFRSFAFLFFSFVIVGIPLAVYFYLLGVIDNYLNISFFFDPATPIGTIILVILDIGRMFLLTLVVWRLYLKRKVNYIFRRHFLFSKQRVG